MLKAQGWEVNHKRVERIWRQEGLKVPQKQKKRGRLYFNDGSCVRLRPLYKNHVWSYDFLHDVLIDGRKIKFLNVMDEYTRKSLKIAVDYSFKSNDVLKVLMELFITEEIPAYIRSDNGPEFIAKAVQDFLEKINVKTVYITPGSPWKNGFIERFNGIFRDELLNGEIFYTLQEAKFIAEDYRRIYNTIRPHSALVKTINIEKNSDFHTVSKS